VWLSLGRAWSRPGWGLMPRCLAWPTKAAARRATVEYLAWYNGTRLHSTLGYRITAEHEETSKMGNRRKARRGNRRTCGEAPNHPVRVRGFGAACIYDAAGRVLAGLRELRIAVHQVHGGQRPSVSRAPQTLRSPRAPTRAQLRSADRRPQLTRQSRLLA
jgi:hypothetical protein